MNKVLFIEDEIDFIKMLQTRIEASGYQFMFATDGEEGLKVAIDEKPDLILLDIIMPKMNGYEVCYSLRNTTDFKEVPIIIVTASGAKELEKKCIEAGANEIIHKPYDSAYLIERIGHYLNN